MKLSLEFSGNVYNLMRQLGYHPHETGEAGEPSFARRLGSSDYPRFHIYIKTDNVKRETLEINLHLDQKKPIYKGVSAHSGEYDGELVEREAERIKQIVGVL